MLKTARFCKHWNTASISEKESVVPDLNALGKANLAETKILTTNSKTGLLRSITNGSS